ncbi:hypothetical protein COHA_005949 [Chlorella ohadii]|uniref:Uncharacterized protein n=1 Tax=Chlorella ohadii TaxID=2649997 RepID=A0AAD5DQ15_9CHLO|nr:hypothetical protein COHA_005949 [Chlorella ohadii]
MTREGAAGAPTGLHSRFSHTALAVYITFSFALCCIGYDSTHDIIQRSHINKKWFYLSGATCLSAYLYLRPLIRRGLGSASRGYINYSAVYICWLLMAVFYHLPSLESMGINIKADVSMWLACFMGSLCTLGVLHGLYGLAVSLRVLDPRLYSPLAGTREVWSIVLMNSVNLAVVCSVYYSFCGNAPAGSVGPGGSLKEAVCLKWLHPVSASSHSAFTRWVVYGEASAAANASSVAAAAANASAAAAAAVVAVNGLAGGGNQTRSTLQVDFPLDGKGKLPVAAADLVSPIFTMWLTLLLLYLSNCLADYSAAATLNAAYTEDLRQNLASQQRSLRRAARRRSIDLSDLQRGGSAASSWGGLSDLASTHSTMWDPFSSIASRTSIDTLLRTMSSVGHMLGSPTSTMRRAGSMLFRDDFGIGLATSWLHPHGSSAAGGEEGGQDGDAAAKVPIPPDAPAPTFLPMFPWYSGTSADLLKTALDLIISVRVFLGRFDMRTMQVAIGPRPTGPDCPPQGGDGFTYEHLADRDEVWFDFVADTGDGGDPTYAIARCMAAPQLRVSVPPELAAAGGASSPEARVAASLAAGQRTLPRASMVVHGGDLCYPSPTDEVLETRLLGPYQDALPPPRHVHPGHLVVNKPDLRPEHWKHIQHKGWIGGWLMPQEKSYFALRLPHGWWLFGLDLALVDDIDMCQYSYFARIAEERMGPEDQVILVQHQPDWLVGWFWGHGTAKNLRQLVRGPLRGRARLQLAGDLHFMMRHSFRQYGAGQSPSLAPSELPTPAGTSPLGGSPRGGSPLGGSPTASRLSSRAATPTPGHRSLLSPSQLHQSLVNRLGSTGASAAGGGSGGAARAQQQAQPVGEAAKVPAGASPVSASPLGTSPTAATWSLAAPQGRSPSRRGSASGPASEAAEAALAALSSPQGSSDGSSTTQPITIGSKLATTARPPLPMLSPVRGANGTAAAAEQPAANAIVDAPAPHNGSTAGSARMGASPGTSPPAAPWTATPANGASPASPFHSWWPGLKVRTGASASELAAGGAAGAAASEAPRSSSDSALGGGMRRSDTFASVASLDTAGGASTQQPSGWSLCDPEHLVVCGSGGGFLHPTHVFSEARFRPEHVPAAGPIYRKTEQLQLHHSGSRPGGLQHGFPSNSSLNSLGQPRSEGAAQAQRPAGGEYRCATAFPSAEQSLKLGRANLTFRSMNNRFDIVGGLLYFLLVVSVLPRCTGVAEVLEAHTPWEAAALFVHSGVATVGAILTESYVSLATLVFVFAVFLSMCRAGGIGAVPGVPPVLRRRPEFHGTSLAVRARVGGLATQLAYAGAHCLAHLTAAVSLLLLLELAMEVMIKYEGLGRDGYHSLYKWYRGYEAQHFPDPMGVRARLERWTLGLYPTALKWVMAVFDVPEAISVSRTALCTNGLAALTRLQTAGYYLGTLAYYWVLATPTVGFLFGAYLYISVNWFHCHYDEAFSSLQIPHFKGFLRFHITRSGDLEMFGLALEKVPHSWREDPRWRTPHGGGNRELPAHRAKFPSRWVPVEEKPHILRPPRMEPPPEAQLSVCDYLYVPRRRS